MNTFKWPWTAPEHPFSVNECQWVSGNSPSTPIECTWMPLSECEHPFSAHECHSVIIECSSLWCDHEKKIPLCENWTAPECIWVWVNTFEWVWTTPECYWVHVNAFEWILNTLWMLLSVRECLGVSVNSPWTSIECQWTPLNKYLEGLNAHV